MFLATKWDQGSQAQVLSAMAEFFGVLCVCVYVLGWQPEIEAPVMNVILNIDSTIVIIMISMMNIISLVGFWCAAKYFGSLGAEEHSELVLLSKFQSCAWHLPMSLKSSWNVMQCRWISEVFWTYWVHEFSESTHWNGRMPWIAYIRWSLRVQLALVRLLGSRSWI